MLHTSAIYRMHNAGATLIELLISMAIMTMVMGAITTTFISQRKTYALQEDVAGMTQQAQMALDLVTRELRTAGTNPTGATFTPVTYSPTQLDIRTDLNGNGTTTDPDEHIIYAYDTPPLRLTRDTGSGAQSVAENIQAFTFRYLDSAGQPTAVSSAIRQLQLTITARTARPDPTYAVNQGYRTYSLTSVITLRN